MARRRRSPSRLAPRAPGRATTQTRLGSRWLGCALPAPPPADRDRRPTCPTFRASAALSLGRQFLGVWSICAYPTTLVCTNDSGRICRGQQRHQSSLSASQEDRHAPPAEAADYHAQQLEPAHYHAAVKLTARPHSVRSPQRRRELCAASRTCLFGTCWSGWRRGQASGTLPEQPADGAGHRAKNGLGEGLGKSAGHGADARNARAAPRLRIRCRRRCVVFSFTWRYDAIACTHAEQGPPASKEPGARSGGWAAIPGWLWARTSVMKPTHASDINTGCALKSTKDCAHAVSE